MEFEELIMDFAQRHDIADLTTENNTTALDIDGIIVTLVTADGTLSLSAEIGEPPVEGRAEFAELLLDANLQSDAFFAKTPDSGTYVLVRRLALSMIDPEAFDTTLEAFVNLAETWRSLLADFRPAAESAAEQTSEIPQFGASGFFQV